MSSIFEDGSAEPKATGKTRRTNAKRAPRRPGHAKIKPPASVTPGWTHQLAAALTLRILEERGGNPGEIGDEFVRMIPGSEDGPEPAVLLARVYAHLAWRIPGIRRMAKRFEGTEARAGLGSDLLALAVQLWLRNRDLFEAIRAEQQRNAAVDAELRARAADKRAESGAVASAFFTRFAKRASGGESPPPNPANAGEGVTS